MNDCVIRKVRTLKVGSTTQVRRRGAYVAVPFIRLSGKWLEGLGFCQGDRITIRVVDGEIHLARGCEPEDSLHASHQVLE